MTNASGSSTPVLILDNGAHSIKAGISGVDLDPRPDGLVKLTSSIFPNSIARSRADKDRRVYVADEIEQCRDLSNLVYRRPFDRGMLVSWDAEKVIWDRVFGKEGMDISPPDTSLLVTEPYFNLPNIAETYDQMIFEEWEFASYYRCTRLIPYGGMFDDESAKVAPECTIVVDVGYSYTHVVPIRAGEVIWDHVKRIDVGGKLLTNHLKQQVSFRQWNMMDQTEVMNAVREACGYVSLDWRGDLELCKRNPRSNPIVQEYVLPDFGANSVSRTGYIRSGPDAQIPPGVGGADGTNAEAGPSRDQASKSGSKRGADVLEEEQVLIMGNERFAGPELLFNPSDIGLKQSGLPETIAAVIEAQPEEVRGMFWAHIGIFGGLGMIPNLGERIERDLRALCPAEYEIGIFEAFDTANPPYHAASNLTSSDVYLSTFPVTRAEYQEHGSSICRRRFGGPTYNVNPPGFKSGEVAVDADGEVDEDARELRYAMGIESIRGKPGAKGKSKKKEEEEVVSGNWGGRRKRAQGMM